MVRVFYFKAMIKGRKRIDLSPDSILNMISEYDIYKMYMPHQNWKINTVTYSPFRNEKNPSFIIGYRGGALRFGVLRHNTMMTSQPHNKDIAQPSNTSHRTMHVTKRMTPTMKP